MSLDLDLGDPGYVYVLAQYTVAVAVVRSRNLNDNSFMVYIAGDEDPSCRNWLVHKTRLDGGGGSLWLWKE